MKEKQNAGAAAEIDALALDWFVRRTAGLDAGEEKEFQEWLRTSAFHEQAFKRWEQDWDEFNALPRSAIDNLRADLMREKAAKRKTSSKDEKQAKGQRRSFFFDGLFFYAMKAGACIAVIALGLFAWSYWWQPVFSESYTTAKGEQRQIRLPDGSRMLIDTDSRADVALYRGHRDVSLPAGQAEFAVHPDPQRPFHVEAGPLRITVLGTRFTVRHTPGIPGRDGVHVAVEEGRVRVFSTQGLKQVVELHGGQQIVSTPAGLLGAISAIGAADIAPWRYGRVSFDNTPLKQVIEEFERYGDTRFVLADPVAADLRVTGTFDPRRPENFSRLLPQVLPVRLSQQNSMIEIRSIQ